MSRHTQYNRGMYFWCIRLLTSWSCCTTRTSWSERHGRIISPVRGQGLSLIYPGRCRLKKHLFITSIVTLITYSATCLAVASPKQPSSKVWANFVNESGWQNKGIAFLTGLVNPNYGFGGLDSAIDLAEDCRNATEVVPFAVIFSILTGVVTALFFVVVMMYCLGDIGAVLATSTGYACKPPP